MADVPRPEIVPRRWDGGTCIVAGSGPSLTPGVAEACRGRRAIAVNDAHLRLPWAEVLYACDARWWERNDGCPGFAGERWSSHNGDGDAKLEVARRFGLRLVMGREMSGFSTDPAVIHYGMNSGFQAVNLAILFGAERIVLIGFDMHGGRGLHFFGAHAGWKAPPFGFFIGAFNRAAERLPPGVEIVNATPGSALTCFPMVHLEDVL